MDVHLAIAWDWDEDSAFVGWLESAVQARGLTTYRIGPHNAEESLPLVRSRQLSFGALLNRASDEDTRFAPLLRAIRRSGALVVNPHDAIRRAADKATMHLEFLTGGIQVPFTIIVSPYNTRREVELKLTELARLGRPFIIKPANTTGGGAGVILGAESLKDVIDSRQHHKNDKYLLQERILPSEIGNRRAWFRVFWICGRSIPCWWDDRTHIYERLPLEDVSALGLTPLCDIARRIAEICVLDFFSTEIAITAAGRFVAVDYVNEICDMRLKSQHADGVPDSVVAEICDILAGFLQDHFRQGEKAASSRDG